MPRARLGGAIFTVAVLVFALVWEHVQATRLGYEVEEVRRDIQWQESKNASLRQALEQMLSPEYVAREAAQRLGMSAPSPAQVVLLDPIPSRRAGENTLLGWLMK